MKYLLYICTLFFAFNACRPEEEIISEQQVRLRFEKDTVSFDTLFTSEQSITQRIKVYNPARTAVVLDQVALQNGSNSPFTLYVNGRPGKAFGEQLLLGGDSLLLLLEVSLSPTTDTLPYLAEDVLQITNQGLQQEVPVLAYGQNARFIKDTVLACNTVWDSPLPYVIEKSVTVDSLCTLTISKGSSLFFKPGASLYVKGTLLAVGDTATADRILFRNHRLDSYYKDQLGQWGGISFLPGSSGNQMLYCTIRNAEKGIQLYTPDDNQQADLELGYCRIENSLEGGIICYNSDLWAYNTLVNTAAGYTVANLAGGNYVYQHCTFANYFLKREGIPALYLSDHAVLPAGEEERANPLRVVLVNTIVWGNLSSGNEIRLDARNLNQVDIEFKNNLLRSTETSWSGSDNIFDKEVFFPEFTNTLLYDYRPDSLSPAIDAGASIGLEDDLSGKARDEKPDIGALEYIKTK